MFKEIENDKKLIENLITGGFNELELTDIMDYFQYKVDDITKFNDKESAIDYADLFEHTEKILYKAAFLSLNEFGKLKIKLNDNLFDRLCLWMFFHTLVHQLCLHFHMEKLPTVEIDRNKLMERMKILLER